MRLLKKEKKNTLHSCKMHTNMFILFWHDKHILYGLLRFDFFPLSSVDLCHLAWKIPFTEVQMKGTEK